MNPQPNERHAGFKFQGADVPTLVGVWLRSLDAFADLANSLTAASWSTQSRCPGWTVGDVVAHVLAIESELHGDPVPDHEPDWAALPHVTTLFGKYTEVPVDWYRSKGRDVVLSELREIIEWRKQDLAGEPSDPTELVTGPANWQTPRERMVRTRILDTWMHEQDIRTAAQLPGGLDSDGAQVTAEQLVSGLPFVWGKSVGAPVGSSLQVSVSGPGVQFERTVLVGDDGRALFVDGGGHQPTLRMSTNWPTYIALAGGRTGAVAEAAAGGVEFHGDTRLSERLLSAFALTP